MQCICGCEIVLKNLDDCRELWYEGHRVWISKEESCYKKYIKYRRNERENANKQKKVSNNKNNSNDVNFDNSNINNTEFSNEIKSDDITESRD